MKHVIELRTDGVDYARFWRAYFSESFNLELIPAVGLAERSVRERTMLPDGRERICLHVVPRVQLPAWAAKLAQGASLGYDEETVFDPAGRRAHTTVRTPGRDLLRVSAEVSFSERAAGVDTRLELDLQAKLLGVGGIIERFVARETEARYRIIERTLQRFVDEQRDRAGTIAAQ